nr:PDZ and LIM domain protein 7 isoform X8 [Manis javanica]
MDSFKVILEGPAPWGFRLQGGKDFNVPLSISRVLPVFLDTRERKWSTISQPLSRTQLLLSTPRLPPQARLPGASPWRHFPMPIIRGCWIELKLTPGGKAAQAGVAVGDWVLNIDGENAGGLTHIEAQNKIRACGERLSLGLSRAQPSQSKQQKAQAPAAESPRYIFAPSVSLNKTARPFGAPLPADSVPQHNGQPLRPLVPDASKQRLTEDTEDWRPRPGTGQSRSFRILAHLTGTEFMQDPDEEHLKKSRGRYLVALGHAYHPEEFVCSQCGKVLEEGGFFEEKGAIFCPSCYDVRYAPSCAKCKKKITGEIMHALKMTWHVHCFICVACKTPIRNRAFYMEEGAPYCERDYEKMFGTKCRGCDFKIDAGDRFLEALGFSWHDTCFVCAICQINLEGKTFYSKKDKPLCKSHAFSHV